MNLLNKIINNFKIENDELTPEEVDEIKQEHSKTLTKVVKKLNSKHLHIVKYIKDDRLGNKYLVIWNEKGDMKLGFIDENYWGRYGITTIAKLNDGSNNFWLKSSTDEKYITPEVEMAMKTKDLSGFEKFDIDTHLVNITW